MKTEQADAQIESMDDKPIIEIIGMHKWFDG